jgi:hypothetical protein
VGLLIGVPLLTYILPCLKPGDLSLYSIFQQGCNPYYQAQMVSVPAFAQKAG